MSIHYRHAGSTRFAGVLLLIASLAIGLAYAVVQPPWEGFDENAHYSYIQQLALKGTWPRHGDPMSAEVEAYAKLAPTKYSSVPPYDDNGHWTYFRFFHSSEDIVEAARRAINDRRAPQSAWQPGTGTNWQAQHPPLYYALLAPLYSLSKSWSLADQLFLLRSVSYGMAWLALCIAAWNAGLFVPTHDPKLRALARLAPGLWPFVFPGWFPEMARLGNDSLIVLLTAAAWTLLLKFVSNRGSIRWHAALGVICGLGLLTKATFLPFTFVVLAALLVYAVIGGQTAGASWFRLAGPFIFTLVIISSAGWWYWSKLFEVGNIIGAEDISIVLDQGGMWSRLERHGVITLIASFARGWMSILSSFVWSGTWSFVKPPVFTIAPLALTALLVVGAHLWWLRAASALTDWLPIAVLLIFLLGLTYHLAIFIAAHDAATTPGWYLHSYAPAFVSILATGITVLLRAKAWRTIILTLSVYATFFLVVVTGFLALAFAGCGSKMSTINSYDYGSMAGCLINPRTALNNLEVLSSPRLAAAFFVAGLISLASAAWILSSRSSPDE
jgi:hypothetical protein